MERSVEVARVALEIAGGCYAELEHERIEHRETRARLADALLLGPTLECYKEFIEHEDGYVLNYRVCGEDDVFMRINYDDTIILETIDVTYSGPCANLGFEYDLSPSDCLRLVRCSTKDRETLGDVFSCPASVV